MNKLERIVKKHLCLGCGLCESLGKEDGCRMQLSRDGFYTPVLEKSLSKALEKQILSICPAINLVDCGSRQVWGAMETANLAWAVDDEVRYKGSSGGAISALCIYVLERKIVDAVLQIGPRKDHVLYNQLHMSRTREDILANASSRYAPAPTLMDFFEILNSSCDTFCFVGKPCDVSAVKNLLEIRPEYQG
ncbi:MAG: coenzyme F420 hydrogenase/dehydrogenase beta subunit N-terminal domain-containing protein, partial [Victivallales bacterium]